ncbi:MAG: acyl-CoA/acyl-ACP dehydrogenase [Proteobacteria bacterium]|nr:acyl-CoA/acyl-ACP dehydrogenase [Pseudomonadota bacterium]
MTSSGNPGSGDGYLLSQDILDRCRERAPGYDAENRFFFEDFEELKEAGYTKINLPKEFGGHGKSLAEVCQEQRRLAMYAPATALAVNMHLYWCGVAGDVLRSGDDSLGWMLEEAGEGKIFAAGHAEGGNDWPLIYSSAKAEKVEGGYRINGRKSFGSLTPVWDYLGGHAMDDSDPDNRKIVHFFMPRDTEGASIVETWDTLGMRATRSDDTVLDNVFVADRHVGRVVPAGWAGMDFFVLAIFGWAEPTFGNIYYGNALRAFELAIAMIKDKSSVAMQRSMAHHAEVQHSIAKMALDLEGIGPHLDKVAEDWSNGVDHGPAWGVKLIAAKYHATNTSLRVVDRALEVAGGYGIFRQSGMERLFRDARLGPIHPANNWLAHEFIAKTMLGIDLDTQPRWG